MERLDPTMSPWAQPRFSREYEGSWLEGSSTQLRFHAPTESLGAGWTLPIGHGPGQASHIVHCTGYIGVTYGLNLGVDRYVVLDDRGTCLRYVLSGRQYDNPGGYEPGHMEAFAAKLGLRFSEVRLRTGNQVRVFPGLTPYPNFYAFMAYAIPVALISIGLLILIVLWMGLATEPASSQLSGARLIATPGAFFFIAVGVFRWPKSRAKLTESLTGTPNETPPTNSGDEQSPRLESNR